MRWLALASITSAMLAACAHAPVPAVIVPGQVTPNKGPDGNSIILDAPAGLIVIDTGRHPEHAQQVLDVARRRNKPIAAILNTHWHLDHTTGNKDLREAFPHAEVYATMAIDGALQTYLQHGRAQVDAMLADPATPEAQRQELLRGRDVIDHPAWLRPTKPVTSSGRVVIAGRSLELHVAPFAATEADLWIYDPATRDAYVGDLVVALVPFLDTACPSGWAKALDEIAATPWLRLVPGHGEPMTRADFTRWHGAYRTLMTCAASPAPDGDCIAGWLRDAAPFIGNAEYVKEALAYYLHERLRSPEATARYCAPLRAPDPTAPR